jgi:membrane peptidoglycan carboxypeptidase
MKRLGRALWSAALVALGIAAGAGFVYELETSALQARLFTRYVQRLSYELEPGASPEIVFPEGGPLDERRGYASLPQFRARLEKAGMQITEQARVSPELARLVGWGIAPPFQEVPVAGLMIRAADGSRLHDATGGKNVFRDYEDVPPLVVKTLLFIENQELLTPTDPRANPTLEWDRLAKASLLYFGSKMGLPLSVAGGSTLATQLEKFRHSPEGRTSSGVDKLRQITAASLKAYRQGLDTTPRRREIVVDYLNTVPLAAAPGYGEIYGLGEGLHAWFGMSLGAVSNALRETSPVGAQAVAFKHVLALLASLPAPSTMLMRDRTALHKRMDAYLQILADRGLINADFADRVRKVNLHFLPHAPIPPARDFVERKAATAVRARLVEMLGVSNLYELDQLHLEVDTTIDAALQESAVELFRSLGTRDFVHEHGLDQKRLLFGSKPENVHYSLLLFERGETGNLLRVQTDNLDQPFDVNRGVKLDLGSTAKLRTLAHYLEIVAQLHDELRPLDDEAVRKQAKDAADPITRWAASKFAENRRIELDELLRGAVERRYSGSPGESFFTGSGLHHFSNFDRNDNGRILSVREGLYHSTNLVFIRLIRDLVRFHQARLPYDAAAVLDDTDSPVRLRMLEEIGDAESERSLAHAYRKYRKLSLDEAVTRLLGRKATSPRHLAILYYAWNDDPSVKGLASWLEKRVGEIPAAQVERLARAYGNGRLTISDYGYLLSRHPLDVWCVGALQRNPEWTWEDFLANAGEARRTSSSWLFKTRNRRAQDRRLRIRIERDAFARMTPYWQRLGFPFEHLVASYATAIGGSSDRPAALAELMGIIVNDGRRLPSRAVHRLRFARGTPWETLFEPAAVSGEQVMKPEVAKVLRELLSGVVERGTAQRLVGAFKRPGGAVVKVGGKTGTGDNRFETFSRGGGVTSSRALNRTATFVFYVDGRYFGVLTAFVLGKDAGSYSYTSSLPVAILKLVAPSINSRLDEPALELAQSESAAEPPHQQ